MEVPIDGADYWCEDSEEHTNYDHGSIDRQKWGYLCGLEAAREVLRPSEKHESADVQHELEGYWDAMTALIARAKKEIEDGR